MRYSGSTQLLTQTGRDDKTSKREEFLNAKLLIDVFIINYREGTAGGLGGAGRRLRSGPVGC